MSYRSVLMKGLILVVGSVLATGVQFAISKYPDMGASLLGLFSSSLSLDHLPEQAQLMLPSQFAALDSVPPPSEDNARAVFVPPGLTLQELRDKPFHVYHPDFVGIMGGNPTLTLIADSGTDPVFHEANVWYPPTDEMFFVQSAGNPNTGTGLHKSAMIQKISVAEAASVSHRREAVGLVKVHTVDSEPQVINPNGATNFNGDILFTGEGMGPNVASALYAMNPVPPYNTSVLVNHYHGRQFNSLNDVAVHPHSKSIYFTDPTYGLMQDFRPKPGMPNQIYKLDPVTKALTVVADGFNMCNGIGFSPDGRYAYVTDTGAEYVLYGTDYHNRPATIYRFNVSPTGGFEHRITFAYASPGVPDGVSCDSDGNVYAGCNDGVHVWNPAGTLLGKIFTGETVANFQFAGDGRMVLCAETHLYYATLKAKGAPIT